MFLSHVGVTPAASKGL